MFLTIGIPTYDDFDGVYFTLQALKTYQDLNDVELLVVDTKSPDACKDTKKVCDAVGASYYHKPEFQGTAPAKNAVFDLAKGKFVLCIDSHVVLVKDVIKNLKEYLKKNENTKNLIQGPLLYDDHKHVSTHFDAKWRGQMFGTWGTDPRHLTHEEFEIPMQGMGFFCMKKEFWPKFNENFRGFGAEEGYIHEKVRQNGGKVICLSSAKWIHRFGRPRGVPYPLHLNDRIINYLIGFAELGLNYGEVIEHFKSNLKNDQIAKCLSEFTKVIPLALTTSTLKNTQSDKIAYILDTESSSTFTSFNCKFDKKAIENKSFIYTINEFVNSNKPYCVIIKEGEILDQKTIDKIDEWIVLKQNMLHIAALKETVTNSLKRKNFSFSYRIADDLDIDESKSLVISRDFAKEILKGNEGIKLSKVANKMNVAPFVLIYEDFIFRMNPVIHHLDNISGNLDFCDIREIVWRSIGKWCLDISALDLQTTLALCQKGAGIVRVFDHQNQDKESLKKELDGFGYPNFVVAELTEDIQPPEDNKQRVLLINYKNLPDYLKDFAHEKQSSFIRKGDTMILCHPTKETIDVIKNMQEYKTEFTSEKCIITIKK
jgi:glycosyltransferase involved in cell wall biosynthesis